MDSGKLAPILVSVFNRYLHFVSCIESLKKNPEAVDSELYIAIDYPVLEHDFTAHKQIIDYSESISGFKRIHLLVRKSNLGSKENIWSARDAIFETFDRLIFTEDDNIFSQGFLKYVNEGLECYEKDPSIFAVNAYNYPVDLNDVLSGDIYKYVGYCAWGVGLWRDKWKAVVWDREFALKFVLNPLNFFKTRKIADHYYLHFIDYARTGHYVGDAIICMNLIKNSMYCIFPVQSLVKNIGTDGSGIHKVRNLAIADQIVADDQILELNMVSTREQKIINSRLREHFSIGVWGYGIELYRFLFRRNRKKK